MLGKLCTVCSLVVLLLMMYGLLVNIQKVEENQCKMTYMFEYPQFSRISFPEDDNFTGYGLYAYSEGHMVEMVRRMEFTGAPVLFIPGNGGSYKQARSLASVALRKGLDNGWRQHLDYFTIDFNEQYSGLYGGLLERQTEYVQECIKSILKLYTRFPNGAKSIVLVGHSVGGKIAQAAASHPMIGPMVNTIIAVSSPIDVPVLALDHYYGKFYSTVNEQWKQKRTVNQKYDLNENKALDHITFLTFGGGIRDTLVHDGLTDSMFSDLHAMTHNVPNAWVSTDHLCVIWCLQFVLIVNRYLYSLLVTNNRGGRNDFIEDKTTRMMLADKYFRGIDKQNSKCEDSLTNNIEYEEWHEDIRRNFQLTFETGLEKERVQMIPLYESVQYRFLKAEIINLEPEGWVFGCQATEVTKTMKYCSKASPLANFSRTMPAIEHERQIAMVNLHDIKRTNPRWTHVLLKLPKTDEPAQLNVDISSYEDRELSIYMPRWFDYFRKQLLDDTLLGSTFYVLNIFGLEHPHQTIALNVNINSCSGNTPLITAIVNVPWAKDHQRYTYQHVRNSSVFYIYVPIKKPSGFNATENPVAVELHLDPKCRYSFSYSQPLGVVMARIAQHFGPWIPAHFVAIVLLAFKHQISITPPDSSFKCGKLYSALTKSTPFFVITASRLFAKFVIMFKVLPQPEEYDHPIFVSVIIHGAALGILLILTASIWAAVVFCGNFSHKIILRIVALPIPALSSTICSCIQKFPLLAGLFLLSIAFVSCGSVSLVGAIFVYFLQLTRMYEDYLEVFVFKTAQRIAKKLFGIHIPAKGEKFSIKKMKPPQPQEEEPPQTPASPTELTQPTDPAKQKEYENLHEGLASINFHLTLFLLLIITCIINFPSFLTWAKGYSQTTSLKPDSSLIPAICILSSLSILWQLNTPRDVAGYNLLSAIMYLGAVVCIIYCQMSLYRLNWVLSGIFLAVTVHQLVGHQIKLKQS
ncbi:GPI inositol-deacylase [Uranotaenia lowii]|uniref:GPI inositol-deacylase n=1 Tax=Uranotaenia lowii TaxID=190385 RepID=UPI00247A9E87|nr:GPI inositol-deacylase [Uranotaenia lowii]